MVEVYTSAHEAELNRAVNRFGASSTRLYRRVLIGLTDLDRVVRVVQEWLEQTEGVSPYLTGLLERELEELRITHASAIVTLAQSNEFETLVPDLREEVFQNVAPAPDPVGGVLGTTSPFVLVQVPRVEAYLPTWWPIILGHELAHIAVTRRSLLAHIPFHVHLSNAISKLGMYEEPPNLPEGLPGSRKRPAEVYLALWAEEIFCDLYMVHRWGPGGALALGRFLAAAGALNRYGTHPPGWFRLRIVLDQLGELPAPLHGQLSPIEEAATAQTAPVWAQVLLEGCRSLLQELHGITIGLAPSALAQMDADRISEAAGRLKRGLPGEPVECGDNQSPQVRRAELVSAGWVAHGELTNDAALQTAVQRLVLHGLESGDRVVDLNDPKESGIRPSPKRAYRKYVLGWLFRRGGVLTTEALWYRLNSGKQGEIYVSPLTPKSVRQSGLDVRLGTQFVVFKRTSTGWYDPLGVETDPREIQEWVEKRWGEPFVLHPGELVLAAVMEFVGLPSDLGAAVVTRSSYGRLGLITATAIHVNPLYQGCLTLELVNHGEFPLRLTPGERVAQLVFQRVRPPLGKPWEEKYVSPTGPQFSKVRDDWEADQLRDVRKRLEGETRDHGVGPEA